MKDLSNLIFAGAAAGFGGAYGSILMFVVLIAFMYFFMIRPQKKQNDERMKMINQLKKGDKVILVDGLHAKIDSIDDEKKTIVVDADGIYLTFSRIAVRQVIPAETAAKPVAEKPAEKADAEKSETKEDK